MLATLLRVHKNAFKQINEIHKDEICLGPV
jgi:hypothetical protein